MEAAVRLGRFLRPYWLWAMLAPLAMLLEVAMDLMQPRLIQTIVDQGIGRHNMSIVIHSGMLMVTAAIVGLFGGMGCTLFSAIAGQNYGADMRSALFRKVQSLSFANLDILETGSLITRLTNDVGQLQNTIMMMLRIMVRVPLMLVGSLIMAILTCPQLAPIYLISIPTISIALFLIIRKTSPMFGVVQKKLDALNTVLQENLAGVRVIKAFARKELEINRFETANADLVNTNIITSRWSSVTMPVMMLSLNAAMVATIWIGGIKVSSGQIHVGQIIAFSNYLMQTLFSLMMISMLIMQFARALASAARVQEVFDTVPAIPNTAKDIEIPQPKGDVRFENVTFSYNGMDNDPVLRNVSFTARPGETVAILGATGSGKSTLLHLIPRYYDVTAGKVTIDNVDVKDISEITLRKLAVPALQESVLFSGTIRDNIGYGYPEATESEVIEAAKMAQADDFIRSFPNGYDSVVGQRGVNLSGGQKQRIAIARALLTNSPILILDDSTSAVDLATEARIHTALDNHHADQTRVLVAQRISSVINADKIIVLDNGGIESQGTHTELLKTSPIYREIYESQIGSPEADTHAS